MSGPKMAPWCRCQTSKHILHSSTCKVVEAHAEGDDGLRRVEIILDLLLDARLESVQRGSIRGHGELDSRRTSGQDRCGEKNAYENQRRVL